MHNYYQLLGVSESASQGEIKTAYHKIAVKYHPDKNPEDKNADEYFKIVTEGYNILSNNETKAKYDILLGAINKVKEEKESNFKKYGRRNSQSTEEIKEKLERIREFEYLQTVKLFKRREKIVPHKIRYIIFSLFALSAYLYVFNRWFVNEGSWDYLHLLIGLILYGLAIFAISNHIFVQLKVLNKLGKFVKLPFEKAAFSFFLIFIFLGPFSIIGLNALKRNYHLAHYSVLIKPDTIRYGANRIYYSFTANGEEIFKSSNELSSQEIMFLMTHKKPMVRVSKYNPRICKLEFGTISQVHYPQI